MYKKIIIVVIILMLSFSIAYADETVEFNKTTRYMFNGLTMGDGLTNSTIYTIGQDSRGVMWFGTDYKLNMYDGLVFSSFEHDLENSNSLASNSASNIFVDKNDNVWIGTWGAGLDQYNVKENKFTHFRHKSGDATSLSDDRVQTVFQDCSGTIWVGTYEGGLNRLNAELGTFEVFINDPADPNSISNNRIWSILEDEFGNLIIATSNGLNYMDTKSGTFTSYKHDPENAKSIASSSLRTLCMDGNELVWIGTDKGISLFNITSKSFENFEPDLKRNEMTNCTVNALLIDQDGKLWVGGLYGLLEFDRQKKEFINYYSHLENDLTSIVNDNIRSLFQDRSGVIWIGTRGGGLSTFNPNIKFSYIESSTDRNVRTFMIDEQEKLWIGRDEGLYRLNLKTGTSQLVLDKKTNALCEDDKGNIWIGIDQGILLKMNKRTYQTTEIKLPEQTDFSSVVELLFDGKNLWVGTLGNGLYQYDTDLNQLKASYLTDPKDASSLSGNEIWSMYQDTTGRLWFGTQNGVSLMTDKTLGFTNFKADFVYDIYEDSDGLIWLGSRDGLLGLDLTGRESSNANMIKYNQNDGLVSNLVYGIQGDKENNLWLSTEYGISKFRTEHKKFVNFSQKNGLKYEKFNPRLSIRSKEGEIYFSSTSGVVSFYPNNIVESDVVPNILITFVEVNGKPYKSQLSSDIIQLTHKDVFFAFAFSALDYINSSGNEYAYMLEGFDEDWIYAGNRTYASYTNIDPGKYTFKVKAANSYGVWNETGVSVEIVIIPPWWNTWIVKILVGLGLVFLILVWYFYRIRRLEKRNRLLTIMVEERTKKLAIANEELSELASIDSLTQLKNRGFGDKHLDVQWKLALREKTELSVLLIDIDFFKDYNDFYGHPQGDECLKLFAGLLNKLMRRPLDVASRYGGEEFMVILPKTTLNGAMAIANKIHQELELMAIPHETSTIRTFVTCSMGVVTLIPNDAINVAELRCLST